MHDMYKIIRRPVVTEKGSALKAESNQVIFDVAKWANKLEIRQAVESIFSVTVKDVRTMNYRGKVKRVGRNIGRQSNWKKAVVTLAEGNDIDVLGTGAEV